MIGVLRPLGMMEMPTLKPDQQGGFAFDGVIRFERMDTLGSLSANLVFRFEDGFSLGMHLQRPDLIALHAALADWLHQEPAAKDEPLSRH
jgi:hypothetical protein